MSSSLPAEGRELAGDEQSVGQPLLEAGAADETEPRGADPAETQRRLANGLLIALLIQLVSTGVSFCGFFVAGSMAMLADAIHMVVDCVTYAVNWWTERQRSSPGERTWLGDFSPLFSSLVFIAAATVMIWQSAEEMHSNEDLNPTLMLVFALVGLACDLFSMVAMKWGLFGMSLEAAHGHGHAHQPAAEEEGVVTMNVLAAALHIAIDLARSVTVVIVSIVLFSADMSKSKQSAVDAITAICMCAVGIVLSVWLFYHTCAKMDEPLDACNIRSQSEKPPQQDDEAESEPQAA